ncbi:MAG: hypothetical protein R3C10_07735 [Pirellulales bacterium]
MSDFPSEHDLEAYLDEALPAAQMAEIELALRRNPKLTRRLALINSRRDAGVHTVGDIWRRHRLTCPTREQLGGYLLGVVDDDLSDYIRFHLDDVGCRLCLANKADLEAQQGESAAAQTRRRRYFQSSAGLLRRDDT